MVVLYVAYNIVVYTPDSGTVKTLSTRVVSKDTNTINIEAQER